MTYRASFAHWEDESFADLGIRTFEWLAEPSSTINLEASIALSPLTTTGIEANKIITALLEAYAHQLSYVLEKVYAIRLLRLIEFATGSDLDNIWGRVYELKRISGESDDNYRKRLQVYLLMLGGSGTKHIVEEVVSIIVESPDSCSADTYYPGICRVYINDERGRIKARERIDLINQVLPETIASGITYRFYIPYYDLSADIALRGPEYLSLPADIALISKTTIEFDARIFLAMKHSEVLDSYMRLAAIPQTSLPAYIDLRAQVESELDASMRLMAPHYESVDASIVSMAPIESHSVATIRLFADHQFELESDIAIRADRYRPIEARMLLEA